MKSLIVYGPRGCGKTTHAAKIASYYGLTTIVDPWDGASFEAEGHLYLTNIAPQRRAKSYDKVVKEIG